MLDAKPFGACGVLLALAGCTEFASPHDRGEAVSDVRETPVSPRPLREDPGRPRRASDAGVSGAEVEDASAPELVAPADAASPEASIADGGAGDACSDGRADGASCYRVSAGAASWDTAQSDCESWGGALVRIDSADEDAFVAGLSAESVWIGAGDRAQAGAFRWTDGQDLEFTNWGAEQPDAFPGQDCVEKREEPGEAWYDQECELAKYYVCERSLNNG